MAKTNFAYKMKRGALFYLEYSLLSITFILTLPFFIIILIFLKSIRHEKRTENITEWYQLKFQFWEEIIDLHKLSGYRYKLCEITYLIYEDKRDGRIRNMDKIISMDIELFSPRTIIYFEPYNCPSVKKVINKKYSTITAYSKTKCLSFFFGPKAVKVPKKVDSFEIIFDSHWINGLLKDWLDDISIEGPCLIFNTGLRTSESSKILHRVHYLPEKRRSAILNAINHFIYKLPNLDRRSYTYLQKI